MNILKIINRITVIIPLLFLISFFILFIQRKQGISNNVIFGIFTLNLLVISFFSILLAIILLCFRYFKNKEKIPYPLLILIFIEMILVLSIYFNVFKITWYVFG